MKVAKFGGSSVANVTQIQKVGAIIESDPKRKFIVVSAPGKRYDEDFKITDLLLNMGHAYINNKSYKDDYDKIITRFEEIINGLSISKDISREIKESLDAIFTGDMTDHLKL